MPHSRHSSRIDTLELKAQIVRKLGHQKADKYFHYLQRFLILKLSKSEFARLCIRTIGRENLSIHNRLIGSIIKNSCLASIPPPKVCKSGHSANFKNRKGYSRNAFRSPCENQFPPSTCKGRSQDAQGPRLRDHPRPLGPLGERQSVVHEESLARTQEQQSATELLSLGSRPPGEGLSVEDGEEVEQVARSPSIQSRSPVRAPLGISINVGGSRKALHNGLVYAFHQETCQSNGELPDTRTLRDRIKHQLEMEGLGITVDCVNLLNSGLNAFLKRMIEPCMEFSGSNIGCQNLEPANDQVISDLNGFWPGRCSRRLTKPVSISSLDFRVAMELNPQLLGEDWPVKLEKIHMHSSEESNRIL